MRVVLMFLRSHRLVADRMSDHPNRFPLVSSFCQAGLPRLRRRWGGEATVMEKIPKIGVVSPVDGRKF